MEIQRIKNFLGRQENRKVATLASGEASSLGAFIASEGRDLSDKMARCLVQRNTYQAADHPAYSLRVVKHQNQLAPTVQVAV